MTEPGPHIRTLAAAFGVEISVKMNDAEMVGLVVADQRARDMIQKEVDRRRAAYRERGVDCPEYVVVDSADDRSFTLVPRVG